jgi:hypothetical protein
MWGSRGGKPAATPHPDGSTLAVRRRRCQRCAGLDPREMPQEGDPLSRSRLVPLEPTALQETPATQETSEATASCTRPGFAGLVGTRSGSHRAKAPIAPPSILGRTRSPTTRLVELYERVAHLWDQERVWRSVGRPDTSTSDLAVGNGIDTVRSAYERWRHGEPPPRRPLSIPTRVGQLDVAVTAPTPWVTHLIPLAAIPENDSLRILA